LSLIFENDEYSREAIEQILNAKGCEIISTAGGRGVGEEAGSCAADKAKAGFIARLFSFTSRIAARRIRSHAKKDLSLDYLDRRPCRRRFVRSSGPVQIRSSRPPQKGAYGYRQTQVET